MIKFAEIRDALAENIRSATGLKIYFNQVQQADASYAFITLRNDKVNEGGGAIVRRVMVDIQVVLLPGEFAEVKASDLYDIADKLDALFSDGLQIGDRHITIYDTNHHIFDAILNYSLVLSFADLAINNNNTPADSYELMQVFHFKEE